MQATGELGHPHRAAIGGIAMMPAIDGTSPSLGDPGRGKAVPVAVSLLKAADRALGHDPAGARRCIAQATALLLKDAGKRNAAVEPTRGGLAPWQISRVTKFISANIARAIRTQDLAAETRLSTGHFRHAFRCSMGESPYAHVLRRRMEHAQVLMLMTDHPLSQIALDCGFTDQPHLTRLFRRMTGVTPAAWRRQRHVGPPTALESSIAA